MGFCIKCTDSPEKHFDPNGSFAPVATCDFAFVIEIAFRWRADNDTLVVFFFLFSLPHKKRKERKHFVKVGHPLAKLSGSAHALILLWIKTLVVADNFRCSQLETKK